MYLCVSDPPISHSVLLQDPEESFLPMGSKLRRQAAESFKMHITVLHRPRHCWECAMKMGFLNEQS